MSDLIDRQDALVAISEEIFATTRQAIDIKFLCMGVIERLPSTERKGKWILVDDYPYKMWKCDRCGCMFEVMMDWKPKYCPNCGVRMVNGDD